jgi:hypothetical protein
LLPSNGTYDLSEITLTYYPLENISIIFNFSGIQSLPEEFIGNLTIQQDHQILITFLDCELGSYFSQTNINGTSYGICKPCGIGTYLLDPNPFPSNQGPCKQCNFDLFDDCSKGYLALKKGIWRMNATADIVLACGYVDACPGGMNITNFVNYTCGEGYQGNLCNDCPEGHGKFGTEPKCYECKKDSIYYLKFIGVLLAQGL